MLVTDACRHRTKIPDGIRVTGKMAKTHHDADTAEKMPMWLKNAVLFRTPATSLVHRTAVDWPSISSVMQNMATTIQRASYHGPDPDHIKNKDGNQSMQVTIISASRQNLSARNS